jgi:hypothetical protein
LASFSYHLFSELRTCRCLSSRCLSKPRARTLDRFLRPGRPRCCSMLFPSASATKGATASPICRNAEAILPESNEASAQLPPSPLYFNDAAAELKKLLSMRLSTIKDLPKRAKHAVAEQRLVYLGELIQLKGPRQAVSQAASRFGLKLGTSIPDWSRKKTAAFEAWELIRNARKGASYGLLAYSWRSDQLLEVTKELTTEEVTTGKVRMPKCVADFIRGAWKLRWKTGVSFGSSFCDGRFIWSFSKPFYTFHVEPRGVVRFEFDMTDRTLLLGTIWAQARG